MADGRAFALAAGDVNDAQPVVRVAEPAEQRAHAVELEVVGLRDSAARN